MDDQLHECGRPLHVNGQPEVRYIVGERHCDACKALDEHKWKHYPNGVPSWVEFVVMTEDEVRAGMPNA